MEHYPVTCNAGAARATLLGALNGNDEIPGSGALARCFPWTLNPQDGSVHALSSLNRALMQNPQQHQCP